MTSHILPRVRTEAEFDAWVADPVNVEPVLAELANDFHTGPLTRPQRGSAIVGVGQTEVIKVMAPHDRSYHDTEVACLAALDLPIRTPRPIEACDWHGWPTLRMERLPGRELAEAWPTLSRRDRMALSTQLGECLAALHASPAPPGVVRLDWAQWCQEPRDLRAPEGLEVGEFLAGVDLAPGTVGWLHTEIMREHLLIQDGRLSGLFDFEPSWVAPVDYEFASVGLFWSAGDTTLFHEVQRAAGVDVPPDRAFAMACQHRYVNLRWYHERLGGPLDAAALAEHWFG